MIIKKIHTWVLILSNPNIHCYIVVYTRGGCYSKLLISCTMMFDDQWILSSMKIENKISHSCGTIILDNLGRKWSKLTLMMFCAPARMLWAMSWEITPGMLVMVEWCSYHDDDNCSPNPPLSSQLVMMDNLWFLFGGQFVPHSVGGDMKWLSGR